MLRSSKAIIGLVRPMSQFGMLRGPISSYSQTTIIQDQIPTPTSEDELQNHFKEQAMIPYIDKEVVRVRKSSKTDEKDAEETRKLLKELDVSKKDKINVFISKLLELDDNKEVVYGALEAWVAEEKEFPIGRLKTALITLERKGKWLKVVQVIKWMLSKGQGITVGTYGQLIRALAMDNRVEEAKKLWVRKLSRDVDTVPWKVCEIIISVYHRNEMWEELATLYKKLEVHGRKVPDKYIAQKVADSYEKLGLVEEKDRVMEKYKSLFIKTRGRYGRKPSSKESSKSAVL
ncbi:pentatricopeptide repeat-containing protein [Tanacetum coccineum]|uniref:Pentatricopeptide repeat-containing protein n=2 Tax=Tanacetum coccineum TaxID=301880 RepID=A0ABQ5JCG4_9ASTR